VAYALSDYTKLIDLDDLEDHWQPVRSAVLATAGFLFVVRTALDIY